MTTSLQDLDQIIKTWPSAYSPPLDIFETDNDDVEYDPSSFTPIGNQRYRVIYLVVCEDENDERNFEQLCFVKKNIWRVENTKYLNTLPQRHTLILENTKDYIGNSADSIATMDQLSDLWQFSGTQDIDIRGTYSPTYKRKMLFSKPLTFRTSALRKWKPKAIIGKRSFEEEND